MKAGFNSCPDIQTVRGMHEADRQAGMQADRHACMGQACMQPCIYMKQAAMHAGRHTFKIKSGAPSK